MLRAYPNYIIDIERLESLLNKYLPQSIIGDISWIIGPDLSIVITDNLKVAKIDSVIGSKSGFPVVIKIF